MEVACPRLLLEAALEAALDEDKEIRGSSLFRLSLFDLTVWFSSCPWGSLHALATRSDFRLHPRFDVGLSIIALADLALDVAASTAVQLLSPLSLSSSSGFRNHHRSLDSRNCVPIRTYMSTFAPWSYQV